VDQGQSLNFCVVVPVANEAGGVEHFSAALRKNLDFLKSGCVFFIVDNASRDNTLEVCLGIAQMDSRFKVIWCPENRNVVDAYLKGYRETYRHFDYIIEMDAGFSHDPNALPLFIEKLKSGIDLVYGSRFMKGGRISDASPLRLILSCGGTMASNFFLGMRMKDMTSGYIGMSAAVASIIAESNFLSRGHFYQTELRYLLRNIPYVEIPIHYKSPSKRMKIGSVMNAFSVLFHYFRCRFRVMVS